MKFELVRSLFPANLFVHLNNDIIWGLKTLSEEQQTNEIIELLTAEDQDAEYFIDKELLHKMSFIAGDLNFKYSGSPKEKAELLEVKGRKTHPRSQRISANALALADHKCEIDSNHPSFIRKNTEMQYVEPHHLIPLEFHYLFTVSLDVEENIISLCSNCHNQLHYGKGIKPLLSELFEQRKNLLASVGIQITLKELFKMYNA